MFNSTKKILFLALAVIFVLIVSGFVGCVNKDKDPSSQSSANTLKESSSALEIKRVTGGTNQVSKSFPYSRGSGSCLVCNGVGTCIDYATASLSTITFREP